MQISNKTTLPRLIVTCLFQALAAEHIGDCGKKEDCRYCKKKQISHFIIHGNSNALRVLFLAGS